MSLSSLLVFRHVLAEALTAEALESREKEGLCSHLSAFPASVIFCPLSTIRGA